jgi:hypothetical protein
VAGLTLDAGALIAYERSEPRVREILATALARGLVPTIPAAAVAISTRTTFAHPRVVGGGQRRLSADRTASVAPVVGFA